jgi:hypothetical protein
MDLKAGDRVVAESESTERPARTGTVDEVLVESRRYRIRWDDGHTSVYTPAAGALTRLEDEPATRQGRGAILAPRLRPAPGAGSAALAARGPASPRRELRQP